MKTLESAGVSLGQATKSLHVLAAANHFQWMRWQAFVVPQLEAGNAVYLAALQSGDLPDELTNLLHTDAEMAAKLVKRIVREFPYEPPVNLIITRKHRQFMDWAAYAASGSQDDIRRWKQECVADFVDLSPRLQESDYREAARDLRVIADTYGLVLPDPLPHAAPLLGRARNQRIASHLLGSHGAYTVSIQPWSRTCVACGQTVSMR